MPFLGCFSSALSGTGLALELLLSSGTVPCVILLTRVKGCFCGSWGRGDECFLVAVLAVSEDVSWVCYLRAVGPSPLWAFPQWQEPFLRCSDQLGEQLCLDCVSALMRQLFLVICSLSMGLLLGVLVSILGGLRCCHNPGGAIPRVL